MTIFQDFDFSEVKGILFDFDNTMYRYQPCHEKGLQALYQEFSTVMPLPFEDFLMLYKEAQNALKLRTEHQAASHSRLLYVQYMLEKMLKRTDTDKSLFLEEVYWDAFMGEMQLREGVRQFIDECRKHGIILCIITDLTASIQFRKIRRLGLSGLFDFVVTSEEAGVEKPDPLIFSYALEKMGLHPKDVVMIGDDSKKDIDGARNHNIRAFQVT
jgi:putative hydrolase of the HAD superfamily